MCCALPHGMAFARNRSFPCRHCCCSHMFYEPHKKEQLHSSDCIINLHSLGACGRLPLALLTLHGQWPVAVGSSHHLPESQCSQLGLSGSASQLWLVLPLQELATVCVSMTSARGWWLSGHWCQHPSCWGILSFASSTLPYFRFCSIAACCVVNTSSLQDWDGIACICNKPLCIVRPHSDSAASIGICILVGKAWLPPLNLMLLLAHLL